MLQRCDIAAHRLAYLLQVMADDCLAPDEKVRQLADSLAEHYQTDSYRRCRSMGELVRENLETLRRRIAKPVIPQLREAEFA